MKRRALEAARLVQIDGLMDRKPSELSGGQRRRCDLARLLVGTWDVILMDEPTNHLDLPSIECLEAALAEAPCALLLVSHDARFLSKLTRTRWELTPTTPTQIELNVVL